jgi:hypothetical protein
MTQFGAGRARLGPPEKTLKRQLHTNIHPNNKNKNKKGRKKREREKGKKGKRKEKNKSVHEPSPERTMVQCVIGLPSSRTHRYPAHLCDKLCPAGLDGTYSMS